MTDFAATFHQIRTVRRDWRVTMVFFQIVRPIPRYFHCAAALLAVFTAAAAPVSVEAQRDGGALRLHATVLMDAAPEAVWNTLTDYDGQLRFLPGLTESKVITRDATGCVVRQKG